LSTISTATTVLAAYLNVPKELLPIVGAMPILFGVVAKTIGQLFKVERAYYFSRKREEFDIVKNENGLYMQTGKGGGWNIRMLTKGRSYNENSKAASVEVWINCIGRNQQGHIIRIISTKFRKKLNLCDCDKRDNCEVFIDESNLNLPIFCATRDQRPSSLHAIQGIVFGNKAEDCYRKKSTRKIDRSGCT
jgi:hypothetical protein